MTDRLLTAAFVTACTGAAMVGAQAPARSAPEPGPRIEVVIAGELVLSDDEDRAVLRDGDGHLVTRPGDVIRYRLTASNRGGEAARNTELLDPIPAGTEYVIGSAQGEGMRVLFSIDNGQTFVPEPVRYRTRTTEGEVRELPAPARMYTHVKWLSPEPIPPDGMVEATFEVRVSRHFEAPDADLSSDDPSSDDPSSDDPSSDDPSQD